MVWLVTINTAILLAFISFMVGLIMGASLNWWDSRKKPYYKDTGGSDGKEERYSAVRQTLHQRQRYSEEKHGKEHAVQPVQEAYPAGKDQGAS